MDKSLSKSGMLIIILASLVGLALTIFAVNNSINAIKTKSWSTTEGIVIYSQVEQSSRYIPKITYNYTVGTDEYSSDRVRLTNMAQYKKKDGATVVTDKYPLDAKVTVYYNPAKPNEALLEPGIKGEHIFMFLLGLVIFLAPLLNFVPFNRKPKEGV
ncbi:MAG: DUF3592 domain-containing protein [Tenuifilaceae bacterium]